jgi:DNA primase
MTGFLGARLVAGAAGHGLGRITHPGKGAGISTTGSSGGPSGSSGFKGGGFPQDFVEEVRRSASLAAVIGEHVTLKRSGRTLKGLCPFHGEKTPSFHVDEDKGFFHCFGCDAGGDVYRFLMMKEALSFPEAVRHLAGRAGIAVPENRPRGPKDELRDRILDINQQAQAAYVDALLSRAASSDAKAARDYLAGRGIVDQVIESFGIGWAPDSWDFLATRLSGRYSENDLKTAGIVSPRRSGSGVYDRFRSRVTFPIRAVSEKVVAFGGRIIGDGEPKYLNSPETPIYRKGEQIYGLERARGAIRQAGEAVLVEGYLDAISLHAHGVTNAVAVLGTALTSAQARLLSRYAERVVINFDGDAAGRKATLRSLEVLLEQGLNVKVLELPPGSDPDDYVRAKGGESYLREVESAGSFFDFLLRVAQSEHDVSVPTGRVDALQTVLPYVIRMEDRVLRSELADNAADALRLPRALVQDEVRRKTSRNRDSSGEASRRQLLVATQAEKTLLAWLVADQDVRTLCASLIDPPSLQELARPQLFQRLLEAPPGSLDLGSVLEGIEDDEQRTLLSRCAVDPELAPVHREDFEGRVRALVEEIGLSPKRRAARRKAEVEKDLAEAFRRGDQAAAQALNAELHDIARALH